MQMRRNYMTTNRRMQVQQYLKAAEECEDAGYPGIAQVNREMAAWLSPKRVYDDAEEE